MWGTSSHLSRVGMSWWIWLWISGVLFASNASASPRQLPGLERPAHVIADGEGVSHAFVANERDAYFLLGYLHAEDRFFQMDFFRHLFSGRLMELVGQAGLANDVQFRRFDLRRAARESLDLHSPPARRMLAAYAAGVNAALEGLALPIEYSLLERSAAAIEPWRAEDSLLLLKGFSVGSWLDLSDVNLSLAVEAFERAGRERGFDGRALFFEDIYRLAPIEGAVTVPPSTRGRSARGLESAIEPATASGPLVEETTAELARQVRDAIEEVPFLRGTLQGEQRGVGSNWWILAPRRTRFGGAVVANDPHQFLSMPPLIYEVSLLARSGRFGRLAGASFAGIPAIVSGCNDWMCWGATNNSLDLTDVFAEQLVVDETGRPTHTIFRGDLEPVVTLVHSYRANRLGDGLADNLVGLEVAPLAGGESYQVPRRNHGPLLSIGAPVGDRAPGLSVQFTGWSANRDLEAFVELHRSRVPRDFIDAMRFADGFVFNMGYADREGNIGYVSTGELPLREDLQELERVDGAPPFLIRDGSGAAKNEWLRPTSRDDSRSLGYEILPRTEMPSALNPTDGILVSANNDPVGTTLDNDQLNELRPNGGLFYLNRSFVSLRAAKIEDLVARLSDPRRRLSVADMQAIQGDSSMLDAELLLPHLQQAVERASAANAPASLAAVLARSGVTEAARRLLSWDTTTPTGITEGFDPGDDPEALAKPTDAEANASVAATIFSVWRGELIRRVVDRTLEAAGLGSALPSGRQAHAALVHLLRESDRNRNRGRSGLDFFASAELADPADARAAVLLEALAGTLERLAGPAFANTFGGSTNQDDYRWGLLHRITIPHPLGGPLNVPPAGGFTSLAPGLPGLARSGGFETIDVAHHDPRAGDERSFTFTLAPGRRSIALLTPFWIRNFQIVPGGQTGDPLDPAYTRQLGRWLTNRYSFFPTDAWEIEQAGVERRFFQPRR